MKKTLVFICLLALTGNVYAQKNKKKEKETPVATASVAKTATQMPVEDGFKKTESGLEYKFVTDEAGAAMPKIGDYVQVHIITSVGDSVLFESRKVNNNEPVQFQVSAPSFKGDLIEGLMMMTVGDDLIVRMSVDSLIKAGTPAQGWMKEGENQKIVYHINLVSLKSSEDMKKEQEENASKQVGIDEKLLQDYFKANNIKATKTASGLYYKINTPGKGENAKAGQKVTVNYTGKTMDGKAFDSNVDPQFQHVSPFSFNLGQGNVIKGWDEGVQLFKKGTKGTLYIPSTLAYGANGQGPIKANSILIFDIEVTDVE
jgi:FKBP-type peptidyl-prolyl cis-trans isomerase FkpA